MKIACFSDVHGNYHALFRGLNLINELKPDKILFLGDAVGYFPSHKGLDILWQKKNIECIRGNHDVMVLKKEISKSKDHIYHHSSLISALTIAHQTQINDWKDYLEIENSVFFHGGPSDHLDQYIYPNSDFNDIHTNIKNIHGDVKICVSAHTHRAFIHRFQDILFVNCGSVGLPRDYGTYGSFAMVDTNEESAQIYRFDITEDLTIMIEEFPDTHQSVIDLMDRKKGEVPTEGIIL